MNQERFLWNKDRTEMVRVGAIKQIAIAEIGGGYPAAPSDRMPKKKPSAAEKTTWVVRAHFIHSTETLVLGIFDSLDEARRFAEDLQRHAEGNSGPEPSLRQGNGMPFREVVSPGGGQVTRLHNGA